MLLPVTSLPVVFYPVTLHYITQVGVFFRQLFAMLLVMYLNCCFCFVFNEAPSCNYHLLLCKFTFIIFYLPLYLPLKS